MGEFSLFHWLAVLLVIVLLFGTSKLPRAMGDVAKSIRAFKSAMKEDDGETESKPQIVSQSNSVSDRPAVYASLALGAQADVAIRC